MTLPTEFSYNRIVSLKSFNPINFEITRQPIWPRGINILGPNQVRALDVSRLEQDSLDPRSAWGAALSEILRGGRKLSSVDVVQAMNFWWLNHEKVVAYMLHQNTWDTSKEYLAYNATWCRVGYVTNQDREVKNLVASIYFDGGFKRSQFLEKHSCYR